MNDIDEILAERAARYGQYAGHAQISQNIKDIMRLAPSWWITTAMQREALEMIAHKIARIVNGDPGYLDNWNDLAGYAQLVAQELTRGPTSDDHCRATYTHHVPGLDKTSQGGFK